MHIAQHPLALTDRLFILTARHQAGTHDAHCSTSLCPHTGGTQRLPRLVGLQKVTIILSCAQFNRHMLNIRLPSQMEVGIEECLHIEFEYDKNKYHMKDTVVGKIYFLLVRIKLKHMEIEIRRRETIGSGSHARNENETLAKYEIMDGAPVRGESIPIR